MILVWGSTADPPVAAVLDALVDRFAAVVFLDDEALPSLQYDLILGQTPEGWLEIDGRKIEVDRISGVYLRPGVQRAGAAIPAAALLSAFQTHGATVINRPAAGRSNHVKPFQLASLAAAGLTTPDTLVTTDPGVARAFLSRHRRIIYKSISGIRSVVAAIEVGTTSADRLDRLGHGPVQLQEWIEGTDVRVHVVGDRWFATSITSDATDYRYAGLDGKQAELKACDLPDPLGRQLVSVTRDMGLLVSGVDLRRTPRGAWYCFEVNPSPGFTYYEAHTDQPIAAAIADLLAG
jgi:glutathione synthase/RimK-type ligase-like ATP-grasp enzyme